MSGDNTSFIEKVSSQEEHGESRFFNFSGRFYIAAILAVGFVCATLSVLFGQVKLDGNTAIAVYTGFSGGAITIITMYMGQDGKKSSSPVESTVK